MAFSDPSAASDPSAPPATQPAPPATQPAPDRPSEGAPAPDAGPAASARRWPERLARITGAVWSWPARPRACRALVGVLLLMIGGLLVSDSVWTLPVVVVGAVMVVVAWVGPRLEGRFTVQWGAAGTELVLRATIRAGESAQDAPLPRPAPAEMLASGAESASRPRPEEPAGRRDGDEVIEGEAHTVEIDVADLKALIAAAPSDAGPSDIRIRRAIRDAQS